LDVEYLNVLKEELLYVHPVVDDKGKGLIWTGKPETQPDPVAASQSALTSRNSVRPRVRLGTPAVMLEGRNYLVRQAGTALAQQS
jgi:hypothetical protein